MVGFSYVKLTTIRWECDDCGLQKFELYDETFTPLWEGSDSEQIAYTGPALAPGEYVLSVDGNYHGFTIVAAEKGKEIEDMLAEIRKGSKTSEIERIYTQAALYYQAGLQGEALVILDQAIEANPKDESLKELLKSYEANLGLEKQ